MATGPLTYEKEPLAEALAIQRLHRAAGPSWIAARVGELALMGDAAGVHRLKRIAVAYSGLVADTPH